MAAFILLLYTDDNVNHLYGSIYTAVILHRHHVTTDNYSKLCCSMLASM